MSKYKAGDKVRIRIIKDLAESDRCFGGFDRNMYKFENRIVTIKIGPNTVMGRIGYNMVEIPFIWDEAFLVDPVADYPTIVIKVDKHNPNIIVARNTLTKETAIAKCHPDDVFNYNYGASLALYRLLDGKVVKS